MNSHKPEPKDNQIESQSHPQNKTKKIIFQCVSADWPKGSQPNCDVNDFNTIELLTKLMPPKQPDILSCTKCPSVVRKG